MSKSEESRIDAKANRVLGRGKGHESHERSEHGAKTRHGRSETMMKTKSAGERHREAKEHHAPHARKMHEAKHHVRGEHHKKHEPKHEPKREAREHERKGMKAYEKKHERGHEKGEHHHIHMHHHHHHHHGEK